jgi:secreted trypsin-like serine protease
MKNALAALACLAIVSMSMAPQTSDVERVSEPLGRVLDAFDRGQSGARILGGSDTTIDKHPWQVGLVAARIADNARGQFCGGTAIGGAWVLTAAHCVNRGTLPADIQLLVGTASLITGGTRLGAAEIFVNPSYDRFSNDSDIALVHAAGNLATTTIAGLSAADTDPPDGASVTVTGWGAIAANNGIGSPVLQEATVQYIARDTCNTPAEYNGKVTSNMLCAGVPIGGVDACRKDSGGPAVATVGTSKKVIGVVSWGDGCGKPNKPGVYTRTSQFAAWVNTTTGGAVAW